MRTGRDDLYRLIQSMSKSEKRYFKMEAKKAGDKTSNHIKLFDAINEMEEYDETHLKKKLREEKFIEHFSAEKRYLYQNILRSLRNFRSDRSIYAQIKSAILDANYLIERGLYDLAEKILNRVEKSALKIDDQLSVLEINLKKRELVRTLRNKGFKEETERLIKISDKTLETLSSELEVQDLYERVGLIVDQQLKLKDESSINELKKKIAVLDKYNGLESPYIHLRRAQIKAFYYSMTGDLEKATEYRTKSVAWWNEHPVIKGELFYLYRLDLNNLISHYFSTNQGDKALEVLTKLESEEPKNLHEQNIIFQKVSINRLVYYMGKGKFKEAEQMMTDIEEGLQKYKIPKATKMALLANVAILYFIKENPETSQEWLHKILNESKSQHRLDIQRLARLLFIVNQIETEEDYQVIDNFCRATQRFFKTSGLVDKKHAEYVILSFLRRYLSVPLEEQKNILIEFKNALEDIKNNPREMASPGLDEFYLWIRSKLEKAPIIQLVEDAN